MSAAAKMACQLPSIVSQSLMISHGMHANSSRDNNEIFNLFIISDFDNFWCRSPHHVKFSSPKYSTVVRKTNRYNSSRIELWT